MEYNQALILSEKILDMAGCQGLMLDVREGFAHYAQEVAYAATLLNEAQKQEFNFDDWALTWKRLYDDYEAIVAADPMQAYVPRNKAALEFHKSAAFVRWFMASNRASKTTSGYAENYFCATGYHPYRAMTPWPGAVLILAGLPFKDYVPKTFKKKMLEGEDGPDGRNPLTPMFPENGKWFYHYNAKDHVITLRCKECAETRPAGVCAKHHKRSYIALATSEKTVEVIESFTVKYFHIDEHVKQEFFKAGLMRVADQPSSGIHITGTPLHGLEAWEQTDLMPKVKGKPEHNRTNPDDPNSPAFVSLHTCSQWEGNVVPHEQIKLTIASGQYSKFDIMSRIEGRPAPLAKNPVFDLDKLAELDDKYKAEPTCGEFIVNQDTAGNVPELLDVGNASQLTFIKKENGAVRIWKEPTTRGQYIIGVDSAAGLSKKANDPSCASVLKMSLINNEIHLELVAQYHAWATPSVYADEVFKLGTWYNQALVVVELTGGYGRAVIDSLMNISYYGNIYREELPPEQFEPGLKYRYGIETTPYSKPPMLGATQQLLNTNKLIIPCAQTIGEFTAYEQERTDMGNTRYRGAGGAHDDRVMSTVIAAYIALRPCTYDYTNRPIISNIKKTPVSRPRAVY